MKKFLALLLAAMMALGLCAVSSAEEISVANAADVWAEKWADVDLSEHVVINYMTTGDAPTLGANAEMLAKLNERLTEMANAEINIVWISWTDYLANYNLRIAAMDGSIDLIGSSTDWLDAWPNSKRGGFLELSPEMLAKYAPVTYATVPQNHWDVCTYNGNIFFIPEDNYSQWTNHGFLYRLDWARKPAWRTAARPGRI
jgi:ABC-type glycerol-3-phosphate transport system substrate-binding protein